MISKNTFGVQFIIRVNKTKDDKVPIYVRITVDSQRVEMSLKRWIQPIEWNAVKGLARGRVCFALDNFRSYTSISNDIN